MAILQLRRCQLALCEAVEQGRVNPGDNMLLAAFGAGLTWGAAVLKWGDRVTPISESDAALPECKQSALELLERAIKLCNERRRDEV